MFQMVTAWFWLFNPSCHHVQCANVTLTNICRTFALSLFYLVSAAILIDSVYTFKYITFMQQALKCKVNILVWGHESHGEILWDFIITSVERKLTIIGSLRSDLIHWAESQAKPRGAAGSGVSEFLVQIITRNWIMQQGALDWNWNCFLISTSCVGEWKYSIFKSYTHTLARREPATNEHIFPNIVSAEWRL